MGKKNKKAAADSTGKLTNKVCEKERPPALHGERMPTKRPFTKIMMI